MPVSPASFHRDVLRLVLTFLLLIMATACIAGVSLAPVKVGMATSHADIAGYAQYLEDPSGKMSLQEAMQASDRFQPSQAGENINFTYSRSAYWIRFAVRGEANIAPDWLLEIAYPSIDFVDFYYPKGDGGYGRTQSGDKNLFSERVRPHRNILFPVTIEAGAEKTFFLRVASEGTLTIPARIWSAQAFERSSEQSYLLLGAYFGTMLALMLYNLMLYLALRDVAILQYVGYVAGFILGIASMNGLGVDLLWGDRIWWADVSLIFGLSFAILCAALFVRTFTNCRSLSRRVDLVLKGSAALAAATVLASLFLPYRVGTMMLSVTALIFPPAAYYAGWLAWRRNVPGASYFLLAWALMLLTIATLSMRNFGWLPSTFLTNNGMQIGSLIEALLLSFALADRYNRLAKERNAAQADAIATRETMLKSLQQSEQMLERRVIERTRELEAANSALKARERQLDDMAHHDVLTGLANRALLNAHLNRIILAGNRKTPPPGIALMLIDLDGFKGINDIHGHAAGDTLLVDIAGRLRNSVRRSDLVARIGGDEFVVILEEPGTPQDVERVAANLIRLASTPVKLDDGMAVAVGASIGIAMLDAADSIASLMQRADRAMYAAKSNGRGCAIVA